MTENKPAFLSEQSRRSGYKTYVGWGDRYRNALDMRENLVTFNKNIILNPFSRSREAVGEPGVVRDRRERGDRRGRGHLRHLNVKYLPFLCMSSQQSLQAFVSLRIKS